MGRCRKAKVQVLKNRKKTEKYKELGKNKNPSENL